MSSAVSSWLVQTSLVLWMTVSRFQLSTMGMNVNHSLRTPRRKLSVRSEELKSRQSQKLLTKMPLRVSSIFLMAVGSVVAVRTTISLVAKSAIVVSKSRRSWTLMANRSTCSVTPTKIPRSKQRSPMKSSLRSSKKIKRTKLLLLRPRKKSWLWAKIRLLNRMLLKC